MFVFLPLYHIVTGPADPGIWTRVAELWVQLSTEWAKGVTPPGQDQ